VSSTEEPGQAASRGAAVETVAAEAEASQAAVQFADDLITHPFRRRGGESRLPLDATTFDHQVAALRRAALTVGRSLPEPSPQQRMRADLRAYANNAGLIVREVELPDRWWRRDYGPMVTLDDDPAALIPGRGRYRRIDAAGVRTVINDRNAATVSRHVLSVVPQLPEPVTNPWQVGRYGLAGNLRWLLLGSAVSLLGGLVTLTVPLATKAIWDDAVPQLDYPLLWGVLAFLLAASFAGMALHIVKKFVSLRVGSRYRAFVTPAVWFRLQRVKSSYFREHPIGVVSQQAALIPGLFKLTIDPLFAIISMVGFGLPALALMIVFSPQLTTIALLAVAVEVVVATVVSWRSARLLQQQFPLGSKVTNSVHGLLTGIVALRVTGSEAFGLAQWARRFHDRQRINVKLRYIALADMVFGLVWPILVVVAIYAETGTRLLGEISVGTFLAFMTAFGFFKSAAGQLPKVVGTFFTLSKVWPRCSPVFTAPLERPLDAMDPGVLTGKIALDRVSFGYVAGSDVLTDLTLQIAAGELVAVVGASGSGKSTLARLLLGLEDPRAGTITYNKLDFAQLDIDVVRMQLGVVMQGMRPFGETVRAVVDGDRGLADDALWSALAASGLAETVHQMPMSLDTFIGSGGQALSGGEVQRLVLARALAGDPRILIMDEATSALDDVAQREVMAGVRGLAITRVVIAQRLSTIIEADRVVVIDNGKVAETGSYPQLVAQGGVFARFVADQRAGD
jgi:ATP-binding cassette subfamily C protein